METNVLINKQPISDCKSFYQAIDSFMLDNYKSINKNFNPVYVNHKGISATQLTNIVGQYSLFPRHIVPMLVQCFYSSRYQGWNDISNELLLNIKQELGDYDDPYIDQYNIPRENYTAHYVMLRRSILSNFGVDISLIKPHPITAEFIDTITNEAKSSNPYYVLGIAAALETSAPPELEMVYEIIKHLAEINSLNMTQGLKDFFEAHIHPIETRHRDDLLKLVFSLLKNSENKEETMCAFFDGLNVVFLAMDKWWSCLLLENDS